MSLTQDAMRRHGGSMRGKRGPASSSAPSVSEHQFIPDLDPRHHWVFDRVTELLGLESSSEPALGQRESNLNKINALFDGDGPRSLFVFHQKRETSVVPRPPASEAGSAISHSSHHPQPPPVPRDRTTSVHSSARGGHSDKDLRLIVTHGDTLPLRGRGVYFFRTREENVTNANIGELISFGALSDNLLMDLQEHLALVYQPALQSMTKSWQVGQVAGEEAKEFMKGVHSFISTLTEVKVTMTEDFELSIPPSVYNIDPSPSGYQRGAKQLGTVKTFEHALTGWSRQVQRVIMESEQIRVEADDVGPHAELDQWKERMAKFTKITEQLKSRECKTVLNVLQVAKSPSLRMWKDLDTKITDGANEAKDNVKYLYTLQKFSEPLYRADPLQIIDIIPGLVNAIKMMHSISRYYNTSERMTALFIKITNQMITACKKYMLAGGPVLKQDLDSFRERVENCIALNRAYQDHFRQTKVTMKAIPTGKQFNFSEVYIFGKFDVFILHLSRLLEIKVIGEEFSCMKNCQIEGMRYFVKKFESIKAVIAGRQYDILDHRSPMFEKDYNSFKTATRELEDELQDFINEAFEKTVHTHEALALLMEFSDILNRERFRHGNDDKYLLIFQTFSVELELVKSEYEKHKDSPPLMRDLPPVVGNISWARQLLRRIEGPMERLTEIKGFEKILSTKEAKPIIKGYNRVATALIQFETLWHDGWKKAVRNARMGLQATLLVRDQNSNKLYVNFDRQVLQLLRESKALTRMGLTIPPDAHVVLLHADRYKNTAQQLEFLVQEYDRVYRLVDPMYSKLLYRHIDSLEEKIDAGLTALTWTSVNIPRFINTVQTALNDTAELFSNIADLKETRIMDSLHAIRDTKLFQLPPHMTFNLSTLPSTVSKDIAAKAALIDSMNYAVETSVQDLVSLCSTGYTAEEEENISGEIYALMEQFDRQLFEAILGCLKRNYDTLRTRLMTELVDENDQGSPETEDGSTKKKRHDDGAKKNLKPMFSVDAQFVPEDTSNVLQLSPNMKELENCLAEASRNMLAVTNGVYCWGQDRGNTDDPLASFYADITGQKDIVRSILYITGNLDYLGKKMHQFLRTFLKYSSLWMENPAEKWAEFMEQDPDMDAIDAEVEKFENIETEIAAMPRSRNFASIQLNMSTFLDTLTGLARKWKTTYGLNVVKNAKVDLAKLVNFIEKTSEKLTRKIQDLEDMRRCNETLVEMREEEALIDFKITPIVTAYELLTRYNIEVSLEEKNNVDNLQYSWDKLKKVAQNASNNLSSLQKPFRLELQQSVRDFIVDVQNFAREYDTKGPMVPGTRPRVAAERLKMFQLQFEDRQRKWDTYVAGETMFGFEITDYPDLVRIKKEMGILDHLYSLYTDVLNTVTGYDKILWSEVDFEKIGSEIQEFQNRCRRLPKALKDYEAFNELRQVIDDFVESVPLMELLAHKSLQQRHWDRLIEVTGHGFKLDPETFRLKDVRTAPLLQFKDDVIEIANAAVKELDIQLKLEGVIQDWSGREFAFGTYRARGELLLKGIETSEIVSVLEESSMTLGGLMGSRYNAPFKKELYAWANKLSVAQETIEQWLSVQGMWQYLEAVFSGGDIARQMPGEAKRFSGIDKSWVKIMDSARQNANVIYICCVDDMVRNLLPYLTEQLEISQKALGGYLEMKRSIFPRFCFVSDPALLEILGQSSEPTAIQNHLRSIFDNIAHLEFIRDAKDKPIITKMQSTEGEIVPLTEQMKPEGNVEDWLNGLVGAMRGTMKDIIRHASGQVFSMELDEFIHAYPAQVALLGLQMKWTTLAEDALGRSKVEKGAMAQANRAITRTLTDLVSMTTDSSLTSRDRTKIETLITIQVHQRDVFYDIYKAGVRSPTDFEWLKQTRFYWKPDRDTCVINITDIEFTYCYEYLGCSERLVITPLTDRCYISLAQALGMFLGGAPAGPAGTGKTETVKDMGKSLGKWVVVLNCSDQMDYRFLARIYKGLAMSGCWGCFDEFNRIELEVLSVAGQQIASVFTALQQRKERFIFTDGSETTLDPQVGVFITMNPGYAGRQELPENLKILFRSVAMMVPDRQIIMRVRLAASGFQEAVPLAKKFFILYRLCEEQLSKQHHYDFGLRNILAVLRTCGSAKRKADADTPERIILMRVLRDMNLSKLVDEDEPLFLSLINDLFPAEKVESKEWVDLERAIASELDKQKLINHPDWHLKVIQLYETSLVRHGIMVLGPSGAGKTKCIQTLMAAMDACGKPHKEIRMNPKAITATQMFGKLDVATNDWTDGIFATLWRKAVRRKESVWMTLDGPVDTYWIESLNTVLDDNRTLTLANGDRIPMSPTLKLIFEVANLDNASPATVSRAGMIYLSTSSLGWKPVLEAWLQTLPATAADNLRKHFHSTIDQCVLWMTENCILPIQNATVNQVNTMITLLQAMFEEHPQSIGGIPDQTMEIYFSFALTWGIGGLLSLEDRPAFHEHLGQINISLPKLDKHGHDTIYEYVPTPEGTWEHWRKRVSPWSYPDHVENPPFHELLVPTVDNVRCQYLLELFASRNKPVLLVGQGGTAKTTTLQQFIQNQDEHVWLWKTLNFSYATTPMLFQRTIEGAVEKRQGRTFGPPAGRRMIVFIDDINMPVINEWGDQVTNEIVRQLMEYRGMYDLDKPGEWNNLQDLYYLAAMREPGGANNDIPDRLKRHFAIVNLVLPSRTSILHIYKLIIAGHINEGNGFKKNVCELVEPIVQLTRLLWEATKARMLPTPAKMHYIFNLRDLSRVAQGLVGCRSDVVDRPQIMVQLWKHECERVFRDRLTNEDDMKWFDTKILELAMSRLAEKLGQDDMESLHHPRYFVNFLRDWGDGEIPDDDNSNYPKVYEPAPSIRVLRERVTMFMSQFNETARGVKLDLVLFDDAISHLVKVSRIINSERGNAMLVGVGGSGKQSLTRLASYIAEYKTFQVTVSRAYNENNFLDDLRLLYKIAGEEGKPVTFIFTDQEIKEESFLEYVNNILSSGEVPNLFPKDELDTIFENIRVAAKKDQGSAFADTRDNLYKYFINRVRGNLHIVLCFSPVGEQFRTRCRKFPGLISGCTIDWFQPWPREALLAVAEKYLSDSNIAGRETVKTELLQFMAYAHDQLASLTEDYFSRYRRRVYVTPKSYLGFITSYKSVYESKYDEINTLKNQLQQGLQKLLSAGEDVAEMKHVLIDEEKMVAEASVSLEAMVEEITQSTAAAEVKKAEVQEVKDRLAAEAEDIQQQKDAAEKELEAAQPALEAAEAALRNIKPADIAAVKKLSNPPYLIKLIMDGVSILRNQMLEAVAKDPDKDFLQASWKASLKLLSDIDFLGKLQNFPKETINAETVELLQPYLDYPAFTYENAKRVSGNVAGLCAWIRAMTEYYAISKEVQPKKDRLFAAEQELAKAMAKLAEAQADLDEKQAALDALQAKFEKSMADKKALEDRANLTKRRMASANALITGLSDEKVRWAKQISEFDDTIRELVGDVALATAFMSYAGPFNQEFRNILVSQTWTRELVQRDIPKSFDMVVTKFLSDDATVGEWNLQGLPKDEISIQNGIIVTTSFRSPLLIDPQGQGKAWIMNKEEANNLVVIRMTDRMFRTTLENCVEGGTPLLIEDVEEILDPVLDNLLEKNVFRLGRMLKCRIGDKETDYHEDFRLYVTTKLANPHFPPETFAKASVIDFTVTMKGLEQQLLGRVLQEDRAELEEERRMLLEETTRNQRRVRELESDLLFRLSNTQGNLVDDVALIDMLAETKSTAAAVAEKLEASIAAEQGINVAREEYRPVATRNSIMYFLITEMSLVNPMYQTSLAQFLKLFDEAVQKATPDRLTSKRVRNIIDYSTFSIYQFISRGLFENHKMLFVLQLALKIDLERESISGAEYSTFIKGGAALTLNDVEDKPYAWMTDQAWLHMCQLRSLHQFKDVTDQITQNPTAWKSWSDNEAPEQALLPMNYEHILNKFQRLLLVRCFREDRTMLAATSYIESALDERFTQPLPLDLEVVLQESDAVTPIVALLSAGSDPTPLITALAKKMKIDLQSISMGQGQEVGARALVNAALADGTWVLLQNGHLGLRYLVELENQLRQLEEPPHPDFRLWLTTEPHPKFPIALLQMSIKLTNEPPQGVRAGLKRSFEWVTQELIEAVDSWQWPRLLYGICFLHTTVQERRKFGPVGWNVPYEFNRSDLSASVNYIKNYLFLEGANEGKNKGISWSTIQYMISEVQYGGRVTDDFDRRLMNCYGRVWLCDELMKDTFQFYQGYGIPDFSTVQQLRKAAEVMSGVDNPEIFGLHSNADISYRNKQTSDILGTILNVQPKESTVSGGATREEVVLTIVDDLLVKMPPPYIRSQVKAAIREIGGPTPLNIFLGQEVDRLQRVLSVMKKSLTDLKLAIAGTIVMSEGLQETLNALFDARVPKAWAVISWPAPTLGVWSADLTARATQYTNWLLNDRPKVFELGRFFNPQGFLTAVRQEITRAHEGWSLDAVSLRTQVLKDEKQDVRHHPEEGVNICGLFLDGAAWDKRKGRIVESTPKVLFHPMPVIQIGAELDGGTATSNPKKKSYTCPVYKQPTRTDRNYIFDIELNTDKTQDRWILRGVALVCSTT